MDRTLIFVLLVGLCGCAGPSKPRLRELLGQCRFHLREYGRLDKERRTAYDKCAIVKQGDPVPEMFWTAAEVRLCPPDIEPEQKMGEVGFDEAGH